MEINYKKKKIRYMKRNFCAWFNYQKYIQNRDDQKIYSEEKYNFVSMENESITKKTSRK